MVVHVLVDMTFQFIDKLLLGEFVNLLRDEFLIMAQGSYQSVFQSESLEVVTLKSATIIQYTIKGRFMSR